MVGRYESKGGSGYRVYITAKDRELLSDIFNNDVHYSRREEEEEPERIKEKERVIQKVLGTLDQTKEAK